MGCGVRDILILSRIPRVGSVRLGALITAYGSAERVARSSPRELIELPEIDRVTASAIAAFFRGPDAAWAESFAEAQLARLDEIGAGTLTLWDDAYPPRLRTIAGPPPCLFYRGSLLPQDDASLAIVGTRTPSPYGMQMAERFASGLGALGIAVVSGLARGIDTAVHAACVRGGFRTLAVIGSGLDVIYPPENRGLADALMAHGALISEFPCGTPPEPPNFPRRNRIVSGMTLGTLVIESRKDGGAMITARLALEQGRRLFVLRAPASARTPGKTRALIAEGKATVVSSVDDILVALDEPLRFEGRGTTGKLLPGR
jgi:DNA processing protein